MHEDQLNQSIAALASQQKQLAEQQKQWAEQQKQLAEQQKQLLQRLDNRDTVPLKRDRWDRLGAVAPIISAVIIASGGAWFTAIYNQQQLKLQEIQTIEKFFPHLTGDEKSKRAAILAISSLTDAKLASNVAAIYASEGTVSALEQIAKNGETGERKMVNGALARALDNMADNYQTEKRYEEAIKTYQRAMALREDSYGQDSPRVLPGLNSLIELHKAHKDFAEVEALLQRAIAIQKNTYGAESPQVASELRRLAEVYQWQGSPEKSRVALAKASTIERIAGAFRAPTVELSAPSEAAVDEPEDSTPSSARLEDATSRQEDSNVRTAAEKKLAPLNASPESKEDKAPTATEAPVAEPAKQSQLPGLPEPLRNNEQRKTKTTRL